MASTPNYASAPRCGIGVISTANTNRDGTGTLGTVLTAGTNGSRVDSITITATGTTTAGLIRLYVHDGTNARLLMEVPVRAVTPSGTAAAFSQTLDLSRYPFVPLILPSGHSLRAAPHNAETFNVLAMGGDF